MKLEIENRKTTTNTGLSDLATLVMSLSNRMKPDLWNFVCTHTFKVKVRSDNGLYTNDIYYNEWYLDTGRWVYVDGHLKLMAETSERYEDEELHDPEYINSCDFVSSIYKIDFKEAISTLEKIVTQYNTLAVKKDEEISRFLQLCNEFRGGEL